MKRKLYVYVPSVLAVVLFVAATVHVLKAQKPIPKRDPLISPAATSFGMTVAGTGIVEAQTENIAVGSALSGVVLDVYVPASKVGQHVAAGDALFRVDDRHLRSELAQSEARIAAAKAQLQKLEAMPRPEELPASEARVRAASASADRLKDDMVRARLLFKQRVVSEQEYITSRLSHEAAVQQLKEAEAQDRLLKSGAWEPDKAIARANIAQAKSDAERIRTEIERATVRAPVDGEVLQVNVRAGEHVAAQPAASLMVLGSVVQLHVRVDIDENDIPRFRRSGAAVAHIRGLAEQKVPLRFARVEPLVVAKRSLSGDNTERIDTRVLQVIYTVEEAASNSHYSKDAQNLFVGQQLDVFIEGDAARLSTDVRLADSRR
jgi:multidrug resistance efflux pump